MLNARLADSLDLYSQLKQAHWNVTGSDFIQLHLLYDDIAASLLEFVDLIAERATPMADRLAAYRKAVRPGVARAAELAEQDTADLFTEV
ncbi:MAG: ferritin-like domain-containing protein [Gaiellaceae bacterium]